MEISGCNCECVSFSLWLYQFLLYISWSSVVRHIDVYSCYTIKIWPQMSIEKVEKQ